MRAKAPRKAKGWIMAKYCKCEKPSGRSTESFACEIEDRVDDAKKALFFLMTITDGAELNDDQRIGALFDLVRALSSLECTASDMRDFGVTAQPTTAADASRSNGHAVAEVQ